MKFNATTIAEKLQAVRLASEYVAYLHEYDSEATSRCQTLENRLTKWGKALTKRYQEAKK